LDFLIRLAKEFKVDGVIWYQLMCFESYKTESYYFPDRLMREVGMPMLPVESNYSTAERESLRTSMKNFIDIIRR